MAVISAGTCPVCGMEMFGGSVVEMPDGEEMRVCHTCQYDRCTHGAVRDQSE
jgi:ribosome-binding protein aMBF1 (putative translation factor)